MLFAFPPSPPTANWVHDFMMSLVEEVLSARSLETKARPWKDLVPPNRADSLGRLRGVKRRYANLETAAWDFSVEGAKVAMARVHSSDYYKNVLDGSLDYASSLNSPASFNSALRSLFDYAFSILGTLKDEVCNQLSIRDSLYSRIYHAVDGHFCPFCGIDRFDAPQPGMPRHPLDHYLAISLYPIFGSDLKNLVPMCGRCNSSFKLAADMLLSVDGRPRPCLDPYGGQIARVSLADSEPFGGEQNGRLPKWKIDFYPALEVFETWDEVFSIRFRYEKSLLDAEYTSWLSDFAGWVKMSGMPMSNSAEISEALRRWASLCPELRDQGFLKRPVFEMLANSVLRTDAVGIRVTNFIGTLCSM